MQGTNTAKELEQLILRMESQKSVEWLLLKEELQQTYEKIRPINLLKNGLREVTTAPDFKNNIIGTTVGLATGLLSKAVIVGTSHNPLKKILGSVLQIVIANGVARHPETIKSVLGGISGFLSKKKEDETEDKTEVGQLDNTSHS